MIHVLISIIIHKMSFGPRICLFLVRIIKYSSTKYPYCLVLTGSAALDALLRQASSLLSGLDEEEVQSLGCRFLDDEHRSVNRKMAK